MSTSLSPFKKSKPLSSTHPENASAPASFLDTFPEEILPNVLRYLSSEPEVQDWVPSLPVEILTHLFGVTGGLGKLVRTRFKMLCVATTRKALREIGCLKWKEREGEMLCTNDLDVAHRFILAGGGKSLHSLVVGCGMYKSKKHGHRIIDEFHENCPNLKSLSINDYDGSWVQRFGGQLEHLDIRTSTEASIALFCTSLRELNLQYSLFYGNESWKGVGKKLKSLKLCSMSYLFKFGPMKLTFPNLHFICIYATEHRNQEIVDLLSSYGGQLEYCHVSDMNENQLKSISSACKNARFSVAVYKINLLIPTLKVLSGNIVKLELCIYDRDVIDIDELKEAWAGSANLEELLVHWCDITIAKAMMEIPKKSLKSIKLHDKMPKDIKDAFSKATCKVQEYSCFRNIV